MDFRSVRNMITDWNFSLKQMYNVLKCSNKILIQKIEMDLCETEKIFSSKINTILADNFHRIYGSDYIVKNIYILKNCAKEIDTNVNLFQKYHIKLST